MPARCGGPPDFRQSAPGGMQSEARSPAVGTDRELRLMGNERFNQSEASASLDCTMINLRYLSMAAAFCGCWREAGLPPRCPRLAAPGAGDLLHDLFHPHEDPDDHFDLAALFALPELDVQGIVLDQGENNKGPGRIPVMQMNRLTDGSADRDRAGRKLGSPDDAPRTSRPSSRAAWC